MLYRTYPHVAGAGPTDPGGPLHVPQLDQGEGRHDNPDVYGAIYMSRDPLSAVAELLRTVPQGELEPEILLHEGEPYRLGVFDDVALGGLVDLDDPRSLEARDLRPSGVATRNRTPTQRLALRIHEEGVAGFEWWSTIEASWINVTLFAERAVGALVVVGRPEPLTIDHPAVREAADAVGVLLG